MRGSGLTRYPAHNPTTIMPTLDDLPTLAKNAAIAANDSIAISNENLGGGSKIQQVPAALLTHGFTHAFRLDYDSVSVALAATTTGEINLMALTEGSVVTEVGLIVSTHFAGGSISGYTLAAGRTGATNGYLVAAEMEITNAVFRKNTGGELDTEAEIWTGDLIGSGQSLSVTITSTGDNLDTATQGSCIVLASIIEPSEYATLVPKFD